MLPNDQKRPRSEYESRYSRQLWDEATRINYFQLAYERRDRLLKGTQHAPIHWDHSNDIVEPSSNAGSETQETEKKESLRDIHNKHAKKDQIKTERPPTPMPKSPSPAAPEKQNEKEEETWKCNCCKCPCKSKQSKCCSKSESRQSSRPKTAESFVHLDISDVVSTVGSQSAPSKPKLKQQLPKCVPAPKPSGPVYRLPSKTPSSKRRPKKSQQKKQPPFAMYGGNANGTQRTYNVKPKSKEIHPSAIRAKKQKERLHVFRLNVENTNPPLISEPQIQMKVFVDALCTPNKPKVTGSWITEYQRNYKPYVF